MSCHVHRRGLPSPATFTGGLPCHATFTAGGSLPSPATVTEGDLPPPACFLCFKGEDK